MYRKDFLQRQFEEFGKVLAKLLSFKRDNDWEPFDRLLSESTGLYTGFTADELENMSPLTFEDSIVNSERYSQQQKKILANLLFEYLQSALLRGHEAKARDLTLKCRIIYEWLGNNQTENEFDLDVHFKREVLAKGFENPGD